MLGLWRATIENCASTRNSGLMPVSSQQFIAVEALHLNAGQICNSLFTRRLLPRTNNAVKSIFVHLAPTHFLNEADQPIALALEEALRVMAKRGVKIECIALPLIDAIRTYSGIVCRVEAAAIHAEWMRKRPQDYAQHVSSWLYASYGIPAPWYVDALSRRGPILSEFAKEVFGRVDVLAMPTTPTCLPTLAETDIDKGPADARAKSMRYCGYGEIFNYLGLPSVSVNCGFDPNGLPIGLSFTGRPFAEADMLKMADAYQQETDWHKRRPPSDETHRRARSLVNSETPVQDRLPR